MFFDSERSGIKPNTEDGPIWYNCSGSTANWEGQELTDDTSNLYGRKSEEEELVKAWEKDGKGYSDDPSSESRYRHVEIVGVGDGWPHFWVRTLVVKAGQVVPVEVWIIELSASDVLRHNLADDFIFFLIMIANAHRNIRLLKAAGID